MRRSRSLFGLLRSRRGNAMVEFAVTAPVMLLLTGAVVEFGLIFKVYSSVNRLATQYASAWSDCNDFPAGACGTELANYTDTYARQNIVPTLLTARTTLSMFQVTMSGTTPVVTYPSGGTMSAAQITAARAAFADKQTGVVVTASYSHTLNFFSSLMGPYLNSFLSPSYTVAQLKS